MRMRALLAVLLTLAFLLLLQPWALATELRNVVLLIGDGMGMAQRDLARFCLEGTQKHLAMDSMPVLGGATNFSADNLVTDSAAAATAIACGVKTRNRTLGMDAQGKPVPSILEECARKGKHVGLVTTVLITDATPAAFASHVQERAKQEEVATQLVSSKVDVLLGGGGKFFLPLKEGGSRIDGRDLVSEARALGYEYVKNRKELKSSRAEAGKLLGLFAPGPMAYDLERSLTDEPSLSEMTSKAIEVLSRNPEGFFLMAEGGKIDWCCHNNDPVGSAHDVLAFDRAVRVALDFAAKRTDTLVLVVNDHETGGMSLTTRLAPEFVKRSKRTIESAVEEIKKGKKSLGQALKEYYGIEELRAEEATILKSTPNPSIALSAILSLRSGVSFSTHSHTAATTMLHAQGPGAENFAGIYDNTDIPHKIARLLKIPLPAAQVRSYLRPEMHLQAHTSVTQGRRPESCILTGRLMHPTSSGAYDPR